MATTYGTDRYNAGYNYGARAGVYPQFQEFSTVFAAGLSPAQPSSLIGAQLIADDIIGLFWINTPGILEYYAIDIPILDPGGTNTLIMDLVDGEGNVLQSGLTTGQAGGRITSATAAVNLVGKVQYATPANAWVGLKVTTQAAGVIGASQPLLTGNAATRTI